MVERTENLGRVCVRLVLGGVPFPAARVDAFRDRGNDGVEIRRAISRVVGLLVSTGAVGNLAISWQIGSSSLAFLEDDGGRIGETGKRRSQSECREQHDFAREALSEWSKQREREEGSDAARRELTSRSSHSPLALPELRHLRFWFSSPDRPIEQATKRTLPNRPRQDAILRMPSCGEKSRVRRSQSSLVAIEPGFLAAIQLPPCGCSRSTYITTAHVLYPSSARAANCSREVSIERAT